MSTENASRRPHLIGYVLAAAIFIVDQISKYWIITLLQLVFYLLMFRTKNEKILPCWNSRIDSRGYQPTNTVEMK